MPNVYEMITLSPTEIQKLVHEELDLFYLSRFSKHSVFRAADQLRCGVDGNFHAYQLVPHIHSWLAKNWIVKAPAFSFLRSSSTFQVGVWQVGEDYRVVVDRPLENIVEWCYENGVRCRWFDSYRNDVLWEVEIHSDDNPSAEMVLTKLRWC